MKQINALENHLNLTLTQRTPTGIRLTAAGKVIARNAKFMSDYAEKSIAETGNVLLTIECWQEVHPGLITIPVNWDYSIPYGLLYSHHAPEDVLQFVEAAKQASETEL